MSTDISPEISKKSRWWIPRERYYELKHFSMQYPEWKKVLSNKLYLSSGSVVVLTGGQIEFKDPVSGIASEAEYYEKNVEQAISIFISGCLKQLRLVYRMNI